MNYKFIDIGQKYYFSGECNSTTSSISRGIRSCTCDIKHLGINSQAYKRSHLKMTRQGIRYVLRYLVCRQDWFQGGFWGWDIYLKDTPSHPAFWLVRIGLRGKSWFISSSWVRTKGLSSDIIETEFYLLNLSKIWCCGVLRWIYVSRLVENTINIKLFYLPSMRLAIAYYS